MLGGASKTSYKSININLTARLSVVYVTKFIQQCDKDFYKYTSESLMNYKQHSNALQSRFFHGRQCYEGSGLICVHIVCNIRYIRTSTD